MISCYFRHFRKQANIKIKYLGTYIDGALGYKYTLLVYYIYQVHQDHPDMCECETQMFTDPGLVPGPGTNLDAGGLGYTVILSAQLGVLGNGPPTATDSRHPSKCNSTLNR